MFEQDIKEAVRQKLVMYVRYEGDFTDREFEPYILYRSTTGKMTVAGYQNSNPAEPLERDQWRNFTISKLQAIQLTNATFTVDHRFDPADKRYSNGVICHVKQYV